MCEMNRILSHTQIDKMKVIQIINNQELFIDSVIITTFGRDGVSESLRPPPVSYK